MFLVIFKSIHILQEIMQSGTIGSSFSLSLLAMLPAHDQLEMARGIIGLRKLDNTTQILFDR